MFPGPAIPDFCLLCSGAGSTGTNNCVTIQQGWFAAPPDSLSMPSISSRHRRQSIHLLLKMAGPVELASMFVLFYFTFTSDKLKGLTGLSVHVDILHLCMLMYVQGMPIVQASKGSRQVQLLARSTDEYIHRCDIKPICKSPEWHVVPTCIFENFSSGFTKDEPLNSDTEHCVRRMLRSVRTA